jgi:hypothetical protein
MKETDDKIVVFGQSNYRFDIPKSHIIAAGRNVILDMDFPEILKYQVDRNAPLPTGESVEKINEEAYPYRDYPEKRLEQEQLKEGKNKKSEKMTRNREKNLLPRSQNQLPT